jgi:predicted ATPase
MKFCGRANELKVLMERWRLTSSTDESLPQVVLIKAERGIGKTRLAMEFYKSLRETENGVSGNGYWPVTASFFQRNIVCLSG